MNTGRSSYVAFALRYAFRNLGRNRRRTALTVSTVLFSVSIAIIANRYASALLRLWEDGAADTGTAHAQVHAQGYWQKQEGVQADLTLADGNAFERAVQADPQVEASGRRLLLEGIISNGEESVYFIGKGVEPAAEQAVSPLLFAGVNDGAWVRSGDVAQVLVGRGVAESLHLTVGSEVTLITQTVQGSVNGIDAKVAGIIAANIPSFSPRSVLTNIALLQRLIRMPARYTELAVRLRPGVVAEAWVAPRRAQAAAIGAELRGWWEVEPVIRSIGQIWESVFAVITALLFLSASLSVLNIIFMMVNERIVEIGTLMAIGARPFDVKLLFCLEAVLIGLAGGLGGTLLGNAVIFAMGWIGVPFENPFGTEQLIVHPTNHLGVSAVVFGLGVLICYLSALAPARKAALVEPVRAFRGQIT